MVGYFPGWAIHAQNYRVTNIPAGALTHINYAFAAVSDSGVCVSINPQDDQINFPQLQLLKQRTPSVKTLISVGGASHSMNFSQATATAAGRQSLALSCVSFMKYGGFDGIDIDWEFPGPSDRSNYTALLQELRSQLDSQGAIDGEQYLLTAALPATSSDYSSIDLGQIHQYLDWINLMVYNFYSALSSSTTHFPAPLFASSSDPEPDPRKRSSYNVDAAVQAYLSAGVPAIKIVVGIPFFGYGWAGVTNVNHGLYQSATGAAQGTWSSDGVFDFEDLSNNYVQTYLRFWSTECSAPWLYSPDSEIMIGYDDAQSVALKADYVTANNLGGVMIWPLSADDAQSSLTNTLSAHLNPSQGAAADVNPSSQPATSPLPTATSPLLNSATRSIPKAHYVPLTIPVDASADASMDSRAMLKFGYVRQLQLQSGEIDAVRAISASGSMPAGVTTQDSSAVPWDTLRMFEGSPMPSQLPAPSVFVTVPSSALLAFGQAVASLRQQTLDQLKGSTTPNATS
jgi:chitinase